MHATYLLCALISGVLAAFAPSCADAQEAARGPIKILLAFADEAGYTFAQLIGESIGLAAIDAVGWAAVYARAGTPKPLVYRLSSAIVESLRTQEIKQRFLSLGVEPTGTTPDELAAIMAADTARWAPIVKASGFTAE